MAEGLEGLASAEEISLVGVGALLSRGGQSLGGGKDNTRGNEADNIRDLAGEVVLVSADVSVASRDVVISVVLGTKQTLKLADGGVKVDPALAAWDSNLVGRDTRLDEPVLNSINRLAVGGKELDNLLLAQVLAVVGGVGISPVMVS